MHYIPVWYQYRADKTQIAGSGIGDNGADNKVFIIHIYYFNSNKTIQKIQMCEFIYLKLETHSFHTVRHTAH